MTPAESNICSKTFARFGFATPLGVEQLVRMGSTPNGVVRNVWGFWVSTNIELLTELKNFVERQN